MRSEFIRARHSRRALSVCKEASGESRGRLLNEYIDLLGGRVTKVSELWYNLDMNNSFQKGYLIPVLIVVIVILIGVVGYVTFSNKPVQENIVTQPNTQTETLSSPIVSKTLSSDEARTLVIQTWGDCTPDVCSRVVVTTEQKNNQWYVTAMYEGLRDDSSAAQRKVAIATHVNNKWTLGTPTVTQSCQKNRGHQDFSSEPCI